MANRSGDWVTTTLYEGLADQLRRQITGGELAPGDRLPSEADLQRETGLSRRTVRESLKLLGREGLIESRRTRGWWVRNPRPLIWHASRTERNVRTDISPADIWSSDVREQGRTPTEKISVVVVPAEPFVADRLAVPPGDAVVARRRLRYADGDLVMAADTYYPHAIASGSDIMRPTDVLPGIWAVMESLGYPWDDRRRIDEIRSRPAMHEEAAIFHVEPGYPMTEFVRAHRTEGGLPVALAIAAWPGDRVVIKYEGEPQ